MKNKNLGIIVVIAVVIAAIFILPKLGLFSISAPNGYVLQATTSGIFFTGAETVTATSGTTHDEWYKVEDKCLNVLSPPADFVQKCENGYYDVPSTASVANEGSFYGDEEGYTFTSGANRCCEITKYVYYSQNPASCSDMGSGFTPCTNIGATKCVGNMVHTCSLFAINVKCWNEDYNCPSNQVCSNGACVDDGSCKTTGQSCLQQGEVCCSGLTCQNGGCYLPVDSQTCAQKGGDYCLSTEGCSQTGFVTSSEGPRCCLGTCTSGGGIVCGDGVCDPGETIGATYYCPADCGSGGTSSCMTKYANRYATGSKLINQECGANSVCKSGFCKPCDSGWLACIVMSYGTCDVVEGANNYIDTSGTTKDLSSSPLFDINWWNAQPGGPGSGNNGYACHLNSECKSGYCTSSHICDVPSKAPSDCEFKVNTDTGEIIYNNSTGGGLCIPQISEFMAPYTNLDCQTNTIIFFVIILLGVVLISRM